MTNPYPDQALASVEFAEGGYNSPVVDVDILEAANIATSRVRRPGETAPYGPAAMHRPLLDIDMPAKLIPSTTPGHFHLFIDREMPWCQYARLLRALGRAGILEPGYVTASLERGYSAVRLPWVKKG